MIALAAFDDDKAYEALKAYDDHIDVLANELETAFKTYEAVVAYDALVTEPA